MSKIDSIRFRMYHTGSVGDCHLLLFESGGVTRFSMLIDCGGWMTRKEAITSCVEDIHAVCGGRLDLLVLTHEHMDHVSGFNQAREVFDRLEVGRVWMSWIEDESDEVGLLLRELYAKKLQELKRSAAMAVRSLKRRAAGAGGGRAGGGAVKGMRERAAAKLRTMEEALELIRLEEGEVAGRGVKGALTNKSALTNSDAVAYLKGKGELRYLRPGEVVDDLEGAEGMKFYVLGPPRDRDMRYFRIATEEEEMYHLRRAGAGAEGADDAAAGDRYLRPAVSFNAPLVESGITLREGQSPFGEQYQLQGKEKEAFLKNYETAAMRWRQIETDWLENAASLAMRVTALTNNTSLALAIEFGDSGRVLLLPGDAQSGNWMGWHKPSVKRSLKKKGGKDTGELLANTVFYKVGHHGSHNGTASVSGLNQVESDDLVVFMPLVQDKVPSAWGGSDNFPDQSLNRVLVEKSRGRLVRTDIGLVQEARAKKLRGELSAKEKKAFADSFTKGPFWVEYVVMG